MLQKSLLSDFFKDELILFAGVDLGKTGSVYRKSPKSMSSAPAITLVFTCKSCKVLSMASSDLLCATVHLSQNIILACFQSSPHPDPLEILHNRNCSWLYSTVVVVPNGQFVVLL